MSIGVVLTILRKDLRSLMPLVLLAWVVFLLQPIIVSLEVDAGNEALVTLQANFYWLAYFLSTLLLISALQLDPAASLNHDWLTRPIGRVDWLLAKLCFLLVSVCVPVVLARIVVNLSMDYGLAGAVGYSLGVENSAGLLPVPLFFAIALLTPTLRNFLFVTILVFISFLLPAWDLTRPLFDLLGVELGRDFGSMMWLQSLPLTLWGIGGAVVIYWFFYVRREQRRAWWMLVITVLLFFFTVYPPAWVYDWDDVITIHEAMINERDFPLDDAVILEHESACFPAADPSAASSDSSDSVFVQAGWVDRFLEQAGAGALTFATTVRIRETLVEWFEPSNVPWEVPVDWRIHRIRVEGRYSADSLPEDLRLVRSRTAVNRFAPMASVDTDYWLIPQGYAEGLAGDPSTRLILDFDLALLSPTPYELLTDGVRRNLPGLGRCRAQLVRSTNTIDIDCIKRGAHPALVSAALVGVEGSRVDNSPHAAYTPDWLEFIGRAHYELSLGKPDLVDSSVVLVTGYEVERIVRKQLVSPGVLGDAGSICPLPGSEQFHAVERSSWRDKSPHEVGSVAVERGVRVEVLDWRGEVDPHVPTLFLLPGLGGTAHSYDDIATRLAQRYNVVGMTRRGVGGSSKPDHGYDIGRLSQDVLQVLDALEIEKPVLVGHSIGGEELSYLGANHPERFSGLIYLDAAYDRTGRDEHDKRWRELNVSLPEAPPVLPSERTSYQALAQYARRIGRPRNIPEGEILASYDLTTGALKHESVYLEAVMMGLQAPEYTRIAVPALAIYAVPGAPEALMEAWYDSEDPEVRRAVDELFYLERRAREKEIARFAHEVPDSRVLVLEDADHWVFVSHEQEVLRAIETFVDILPVPESSAANERASGY